MHARGTVTRGVRYSDGDRELAEGPAEPVAGGHIGGDVVMAAAEIPDEGVACPAAMIRAERYRFSPRIGRSRAVTSRAGMHI